MALDFDSLGSKNSILPSSTFAGSFTLAASTACIGSLAHPIPGKASTSSRQYLFIFFLSLESANNRSLSLPGKGCLLFAQDQYRPQKPQ